MYSHNEYIDNTSWCLQREPWRLDRSTALVGVIVDIDMGAWGEGGPKINVCLLQAGGHSLPPRWPPPLAPHVGRTPFAVIAIGNSSVGRTRQGPIYPPANWWWIYPLPLLLGGKEPLAVTREQLSTPPKLHLEMQLRGSTAYLLVWLEAGQLGNASTETNESNMGVLDSYVRPTEHLLNDSSLKSLAMWVTLFIYQAQLYWPVGCTWLRGTWFLFVYNKTINTERMCLMSGCQVGIPVTAAVSVGLYKKYYATAPLGTGH